MRPKKRLFIGLQLISLFTVGLALFFILYFSLVGFQNLDTYLLLILAGAAGLTVVFSALGVFGVILTIMRGSPVKGFELPTRIAIDLLFPLTIWFGKILQVSRERIENSFIEVTNQLNGVREAGVDYDDLVILAPHCLQYSECPHKVTMNTDNCRRCGRCKVDRLLEYKDKYGIDIYIVTGGTLARKILKDKRPRAVVAIACERDLISGLQDVFPLPAQGVVNIRPEGPCINTDVDLQKVDRAIRRLTG